MCMPSSVQQGPVKECASAIRRSLALSMPASPCQVRGRQLVHVMLKKLATQRTLPTEIQLERPRELGRQEESEKKRKRERDACCCHLPPWTIPTKLCPKPHLTNEHRDAEHRHSPWATTLTMHIHHSIESKGVGVCWWACETEGEGGWRHSGRKRRKH